MRKRVLIVGGGTAGWICAAYMARMLSADQPGGVAITLVESDEIGVVGVGEGTFPIIRKTLARIGLDEAELVRDADATFKQAIRFQGWSTGRGDDAYLHPFQVAAQHSDMDLLPYWLLGLAGDAPWAEVSTAQARLVAAMRAPKLASHADYGGPLNYAYHFDAVRFAAVVRRRAVALGVERLVDTIDEVRLDEGGAIAAVRARAHGDLTADLFVDCTGFRARLIGEALGSRFTSRRDRLFCNRAVAIQLPYDRPDAPIPSCTVSTARESGWIWDIGLQARRGLGYVYSSDHCGDEAAADALRAHAGPAARDLPQRQLSFEAGYRAVQWQANCVAIGLSAGFIEPLEATGISFAEVAALILVNLFPWSGDHERSARMFNAQMATRYERVIDFLKLHYCLSRRTDSDFWHDNRAPSSISDDLTDRLEQWRHRPPSFLDVDKSHDVFEEHSWQYILYGMGFHTDIGARAGALRFHDEARLEFANIRRHADEALASLPPHRTLVNAMAARAGRPGARPHR